MNKLTYQVCWLAGAVSLYCLALTKSSQAQVTSDGTLSTAVATSDNHNFTITGGSRAGGNLFHSFREFSVPNGGSAVFNNALDVQNIISRVTGSSISNIHGLIQANGSANLFLLNPNGIIFGPEAKLRLGGSFLASTANRLKFADGTFFSTPDPQAQPLLTISVPIGLQFGETAGSIRNQSQATRFFPEYSQEAPVGLEVQPGKTLALVGGDVFLEGGRLFAPGGRVELGSVAGNSFVSLTPVAAGWVLGYEGVQNFQDIQLSQAFINTKGKSLGDIQLHGRRIAITDTSGVTEYNSGTSPGGTLVVKASESVEVNNGSSLETGTSSSGTTGDIQIETRRLLVGDGSSIDTSSNSDGRGGNLTVNASESVEVNGGGQSSRLSTQAFGGGDAGELKVTTGRLILRDGGQISSSTRNTGNGGSVFVDASDSVEVSGKGKTASGRVVKSGLFAETTSPSATGNGGVLRINTGRLVVQGEGSISAAAAQGSTGQAGSLDINASKSVEVSDVGSTLLAESQSFKPAGNLTISTNKLIVRDGAEASVNSEGTGNAGDLQVQAHSIRLENGGKLTATITESGKGGGNIILRELNLLLLSGNSEISTSAFGTGNGGNITIDTDILAALRNSKITANAVGGRGGNIQITTQGLFRSPDSSITASSQLGINGTVQINTLGINPTLGLVNLPVTPVNVSGLIAQGCPADVGPRASKFVVTGRGGLPPTPREATRSEPALADLGTTVQGEENHASGATSTNPTSSDTAPLVEAQGWVTNAKGEVVLVAQAPTVTPDIPWLTPTTCHTP